MSETDCMFVGSRGLLKSCSRRSPNPISDYNEISPSVYENLSKNEVIHVCPRALTNFIQKVLPNITEPFILLTNDSDATIPDHVQPEFNTLVESPLLIHWFAQNCVVDHPKVTRIPIGLDYHTLTPSRKQSNLAWSQAETHPWGVKKFPIFQEDDLQKLKQKSKPFWDREVKAYGNFQFLMWTYYGKVDRPEAMNTVPKHLVYYEPNHCTRDICWNNMIKHAFVLSPHGNGLDCHRTWEALCLGCIPIVKTSGLDPLFQDLPVWIVNSWSEVTEENMKAKINEFRERTFGYERLTLAYWRDRINAVKRSTA